jgi:hypothetical protein
MLKQPAASCHSFTIAARKPSHHLDDRSIRGGWSEGEAFVDKVLRRVSLMVDKDFGDSRKGPGVVSDGFWKKEEIRRLSCVDA